MKKIIILLVLILELNFLSSQTIGINPTEVNIETVIGGEICKSLTLKATGEIFAQDRWLKQGEKQKILSNYNLSSKDFDIEIKYNKIFRINEKERLNFCITPKKAGEFQGVLLYKVEGTNFGVGIWINLKVLEKNKMSITGNTIKKNIFNFEEKSLVGLGTCFILLSLTLAILLFKMKKKQEII
jgi:hypothetical protein